jgi:hypothetical protein
MKKDKRIKLSEWIMAGGFVNKPSMVDMDMFRTKIKPNQEKQIKLSSLIDEKFGRRTEEKIDEGEFFESLAKFGHLGKAIYREDDLTSVAEALSFIAKASRQHALQETEEWFDKITVNRNMKELNTLSDSFRKISTEAQALQERMTALYEDMGHILGRYYDLDEALDKVDPSKVEPEDDFEDREDKDIDNDGDTDDSDEYLHKKRQAITKAMGK